MTMMLARSSKRIAIDQPTERELRVVVNGTHAKSGGGVTYLRRLLPELAKQPGLELHLFLHREQFDLFYPVCDQVHVTLFNHSTGFWKSLWWEQISIPLIAWAMGADIVFSPANYGPLLARNHVILLRNSTSVIRLTTRLRPMFYWGLLSIATFSSLLTAKRAIAVSKYAAKILTYRLRNVFKRKLKVVYHGTTMPSKVRSDNAGDGKSILAVSDIYVQKNYHSLIRAFALVHRENPDLSLFIVGRDIDKHYSSEIREMVVSLEITSAVKFLGHLDPIALDQLYESCHLFVFPSTVETFGNPLLEAMSFGVPIACSNTAAMPEVIGDAGLMFDPSDEGDIAEKIKQLLDNPVLREELGKRASMRAREFSLSRTAISTARVLRSACSATSVGSRMLR